MPANFTAQPGPGRFAADAGQPCRICAAPTFLAGTIRGKFRPRDYTLRRCTACDFLCVVDADTDYEAIYNLDYYLGKGADPQINYAEDMKLGGSSIKFYEARGIEAWADSARRRLSEDQRSHRRRWLDFGCGTGYLVDFLRPRWDAVGYETGGGADFARQRGIPFIQSSEELDAARGSFDVVSCVEVLEHVADPVSVMEAVRSLLRPGGLFLFTTGNSTPHLGALEKWSYMMFPEIHISFLSEKTSRTLFARTGFEVDDNRWGGGFTDIYRYKILKNLYVKTRSALERLVPWPVLASVADSRFRLAHHPAAWKPEAA